MPAGGFLSSQLSLFNADPAPVPDLSSYDHVIVAFSGGKDSIACVLHLLDQGIKPELWHHDIDGKEGGRLMDWPVTRSYCTKFAAAFDLMLYFSWKEGGYEREMRRNGTPTAPTWFETPDGLRSSGGNGPVGTRLKHPQVSADLKVRWCSAYGKVDVASSALRNQERFKGKRTLFVTGERAEESPGRAKYNTFEPHRTHGANRHVDVWRPVHAWNERDVWAIIKRYRVNMHPGYRLGWGRISCLFCIFGNPNQWASSRVVDPGGFERLVDSEQEFGVTIHRGETIAQRADRGKPYQMDPGTIALAMADTFNEPIILEEWAMPAGAFGEKTGPS